MTVLSIDSGTHSTTCFLWVDVRAPASFPALRRQSSDAGARIAQPKCAHTATNKMPLSKAGEQQLFSQWRGGVLRVDSSPSTQVSVQESWQGDSGPVRMGALRGAHQSRLSRHIVRR
ncbi:hypothetical protein EYF80_009656 [Liparis tanakae]|uniref:Uncharacterized protein n=1 Tax=Liparis tanakae TaxID=230148 RepID=A0A4Z2IRJ1_9TELE|nr:hypothetical protein EYF80_009656 [Liparis tanakae]